MKSNRKSILKEIELLQKDVKDLQKQIKDLKAWITWTNTFVKKLMDVVGVPPYHRAPAQPANLISQVKSENDNME